MERLAEEEERTRYEQLMRNATAPMGLPAGFFVARSDMARLEKVLSTRFRVTGILCIYMDIPREQCKELAALLCRVYTISSKRIRLCVVLSAGSCGDVQCYDFAAEVLAVTDLLPETSSLDILLGDDSIHLGDGKRSLSSTSWTFGFTTTALVCQPLFYWLLVTHLWTRVEIRCAESHLFSPETSLEWLRSRCTQASQAVTVLAGHSGVRLQIRGQGVWELTISAWPDDRVLVDLFAQLEDIRFAACGLPPVCVCTPFPPGIRNLRGPMAKLCSVLTVAAPCLPEGGANLSLNFEAALNWDYRCFGHIPAPIGIISPLLVRRAGTSAIRPRLDSEKKRIAIFIASVMRQSEIDNIVYLDRVVDYYVDRNYRDAYLCSATVLD